MPQGQQKTWYVLNVFIEAAKILLFVQLHIGNNGKMIAQLFFDELKLHYIQCFINKDVVDT